MTTEMLKDLLQTIGYKATVAEINAGIERREKYRALLERIRDEPALLKRGGAGGQDQYAGMPPVMRLIDEALK